MYEILIELNIKKTNFNLEKNSIFYYFSIYWLVNCYHYQSSSSSSCRHQFGYPWLSLAIPACRPSLPVGPQGYIPYLHRATVCRFELVTLLCSSMWRGPQEHITSELVPASPAVSRMSGSSNFDNFRDGWLVAVQLLLCGVLPPGLVQYCSQHSCIVAVKIFLHLFSKWYLIFNQLLYEQFCLLLFNCLLNLVIFFNS